MKIKKLNSLTDVQAVMQKLGVDKPGIKIMAKKSEILFFYINSLHVGAANILKQDALSIGADLAVPNGTITCQYKRVDALLIGTKKHIELLSRKEMAQPFGLKDIAKQLRGYLSVKEYPVKIMGIINATDDSFYAGSRFKEHEAIEKIEQMVTDGADIIDIGGMSSRPGSEEVAPEIELARVKPIIDTLAQMKLDVKLSIDTYRIEVAEYALSHGFHILNDITGLRDENLAKIAAKYGASVVIMHMQGTPKTMQLNPYYKDVVAEVSAFFEEKVAVAKKYGINDIILDPGIGFGKRLEDNLALIKHLGEFRKFGYEILVGASRKSMIDKIVPSSVEERLPGTLTLHLMAIQEGASIVRCHDVKEHNQAIKVYEALKRTTV